MVRAFIKKIRIASSLFVNLPFAVILGAICVGVVAYLYFENFGCSQIDLTCLSSKTDVWGQAGDYFGGFLNPILSLITITYVYKTFKSERESQYWKVLESIFDGIEKSLDKTASEGNVPLKNYLIELSGFPAGIDYSQENFVRVFKYANLNFAELHNYLAYYTNINRKVSSENRRLFNAALVCRLGRVTVAIGIIQYLYVMLEMSKRSDIRSPTSEFCKILIEAYSDFDYSPMESICSKARRLAQTNSQACKKAKEDNFKNARLDD